MFTRLKRAFAHRYLFKKHFKKHPFRNRLDHSSAYQCDQVSLARNSVGIRFSVRSANEKFGRWTKSRQLRRKSPPPEVRPRVLCWSSVCRSDLDGVANTKVI